jgi:hypothetical protein
MIDVVLWLTIVAHPANFSMEVQEKLYIYDEPPPCDESIIYVKSPAPDLCEFDVPKIISLNRLVLKLSDPLTCKTISKHFDNLANDFLVNAFWFNFRRFVKPQLLLKKLLERFDVPPLTDLRRKYLFSDESFYNLEVRRDIQHRVGEMLHHWVTNYLFDFDHVMAADLETFCISRFKPAGFHALADTIVAQLKVMSNSNLCLPQVRVHDYFHGKHL